MRIDDRDLAKNSWAALQAAIERILRSPELYAIAHENYRRCLIRRFPHAVFYEYREPTVTIFAVFHTARDPAKWRRRVP